MPRPHPGKCQPHTLSNLRSQQMQHSGPSGTQCKDLRCSPRRRCQRGSPDRPRPRCVNKRCTRTCPRHTPSKRCTSGRSTLCRGLPRTGLPRNPRTCTACTPCPASPRHRPCIRSPGSNQVRRRRMLGTHGSTSQHRRRFRTRCSYTVCMSGSYRRAIHRTLNGSFPRGTTRTPGTCLRSGPHTRTGTFHPHSPARSFHRFLPTSQSRDIPSCTAPRHTTCNSRTQCSLSSCTLP